MNVLLSHHDYTHHGRVRIGWLTCCAGNSSTPIPFHPPSNRQKISAGTPLSEQDRRPWLDALREAIDRWISEDRNVVLACSALSASARRILIPESHSVKLVYLSI